MPIETIRFKTLGANPAVSSIPVTIDTTGKGQASVTLLGTAAGIDTLQAFMDSKSLVSNQAITAWQVPNGAISVAAITAYVGNGDGSGTFPNSVTSANLTGPQAFSSLMFNTHPQSLFPGDPHQSGNQANPVVCNGIDTAGNYTGDTSVNGVSGSFNMSLVGTFVVQKAGAVSFTAYVNSAFLLALPGTTLGTGPSFFNGISKTPMKGYAPTAGLNSNYGQYQTGNWATVPFTINFPSSGVYPFECLVVTGLAGEREFCLLANDAPIPAITLTTLPAPPAAGTGNLILTPVESALNLQGGTQTFSLAISGVSFTKTVYVPLLEGQTGDIFITDNGSQGFIFPTLPNAATIDPKAALGLISLSSADNSSYLNRLSVQFSPATPPSGGSGSGASGSNAVPLNPGTPNQYSIVYNGATADPNIASTQLIVKYNEFAWYNPLTKTFDLYTVSSQGGGSKVQVQINWLIMPTIAAVTPSSLPGDGATHTLTVTLSKPLPPVQANVNAVFTGSGGITVLGSQANILSTGFLTGWTVNVKTSVSSGNVQSALSLNASDTITYLSGTSFLTNLVTYINGVIATITT